jgi:hypothetical protein
VRFWRYALVTVFGLSEMSTVLAQPPRRVASAPAVALAYAFTEVTGLYELSDGRVVAVDGGDASIVLANFEAGAARRIGRQGEGPGEYRGPSSVYPLGGDSVGIFDDLASRLLVIARDGTVSGIVSPYVYPPGSTRTAALKSDGRGYFYGQAPAVKALPDGKFALVDSAPIVRWRIGDDRIVTVAQVYRPAPPGAVATAGGPIVRPGSFPALLTRDLWVVSGDGRVAIVDPDPFRVVIVSPGGAQRWGAAIPYPRERVGESVKRRYLAERKAMSTVIIVDRQGNASRGRATSGPPPRSWAEFVPPYRPTAFVSFDHAGMLWIQRTTFGREGARYDLIGPAGELRDRIEFPEGHRVVGFGRWHVYVVRRDGDDVESLHRVPLPLR